VNRIKRLITALLVSGTLYIPSLVSAQQDYTGALVAEITGFVEDGDGNLVAPKASLDASVDIVSNGGGNLQARVKGVASCTEGLGLQVTFDVTYDKDSFQLDGFYTDIPYGSVLDKPIVFENTGGLNWRASISGNAPAENGYRSYDLTIDIALPREAIFSGTEYPKSYSGGLNETLSIDLPIKIKELDFETSLSLDILLEGNWSAKVVPTASAGVQEITGMVNGTIAGSEPATLSFDIPFVGEKEITIDVKGSFGGSLFVESASQLKFAGAWAASSGEDGFGGDLEILVPSDDLKNLKSLPYSITGNFSIDTGVNSIGSILIPFDISGEFPFSVDI